jgi:hypothetical protein
LVIMYAGSTLTLLSGRLLGAHQKIDRVARHHLEHVAPAVNFPSARQILHFEGANGPDGIKRKSPAHDEPWHYIIPEDSADTILLVLIEDHYKNLIQSLKNGDQIHAAFESAWLAHAIVDGLTPAHHYPYEEKLEELREGAGKESRTTLHTKLIMPGKTKRSQVSNNWKMWGPKGLFTTHGSFEMGVATIILPLKLLDGIPDAEAIAAFQAVPIREWFLSVVHEVADLALFDTFITTGWTTHLATQVRRELAPMLVQSVTLAWYGAAMAARR